MSDSLLLPFPLYVYGETDCRCTDAILLCCSLSTANVQWWIIKLWHVKLLIAAGSKKVLFHLTAKRHRCRTSLTCYKYSKHTRRKKKPQPTYWHFKMAAIEVGTKVIFHENGPLYIYIYILENDR